MNIRIYLMAVLLLSFVACKNNHEHNHENTEEHVHKAGKAHLHEDDNTHNHATVEEQSHEHGADCNHEEETHKHENDYNHRAAEAPQHEHGADCNHEEEAHVHTKENLPNHAINDGHNHGNVEASTEEHNHGEVKFQITSYSETFEVFAEADPFSVGETAKILAHFTWLDSFKPLTSGNVKAVLKVGGQEIKNLQKQALRKGIYLFEIQAKKAGDATLTFTIETENKTFIMEILGLKVFGDKHDAIHWAEAQEMNTANSNVFTKEQSWKSEFKTQLTEYKCFGKVIKTTALTEPCVAGEAIISSKSNGIVDLQSNHITEGMRVKKGQKLFIVSGSDLANDNSSVRYVEAKNNYEKAVSNFERIMELEKDKIVTSKEVLEAKNEYENTKVIFENLQENFSSQGQIIYSPIKGFISNLQVSNGEYVEAGYPLVSITKNERLVLNADVQQKYASVLPQIYSANIRNIYNNTTFSLEELNGHILSYGKTTNTNNYLIPISLEIDNTEDFISGSFVELYLKYSTKEKSLIIPNSALLEEQGNFFVYVQLHPESFEKREVFLGATDGERTEVLKGLQANERIVSKGGILIKLAKATGKLDAHSGHVH